MVFCLVVALVLSMGILWAPGFNLYDLSGVTITVGWWAATYFEVENWLEPSLYVRYVPWYCRSRTEALMVFMALMIGIIVLTELLK